MHSEPVTHDNVDPFNAIAERPVPVLMERRCPTSNPGSSEPGKAAKRNRLRKWGKTAVLLLQDYKAGHGGRSRGTSQNAPGRGAGSAPESEIKPTTPR